MTRKKNHHIVSQTSTNEFFNTDGSIDTERAIRAGHEARTLALREMYSAAVNLIETRWQISKNNKTVKPSVE